MFTTAPELRPYSALSVELSTLNSDTVLIDGWNVIWFCTWSLRLIPLTMKFTVSSRLPAVLKAKEPCPRRGAVRNPVAGWGATDPGMRSPRSTKWRPLSGISCTVFWSMTCPTDVVVLSITGASATTLSSSATPPTPILTFWTEIWATSSRMSFTAWGWNLSSCASSR